MAADPTGRPPAKFSCVWWNGLSCGATVKYAEDDISCYNDGNCDGFGTCRGCTKYDQGGMKFDDVDGQGGFTQTPLNLQIFNLRAKIQPCCFWDGPLVPFRKTLVKTDVQASISSIIEIDAGEDGVINTLGADLDGFPTANGQLVAIRDGQDEDGNPFPRVNISYEGRTDTSFTGVNFTPAGILNNGYTLYLSERKAVPVWRPKSKTVPDDDTQVASYAGNESASVIRVDSTSGFPSAGEVSVVDSNVTLRGNGSYSGRTANTFTGYSGTQPQTGDSLILVVSGDSGEKATYCTLIQAAPWQEGLTTENPSPYGCNGAKPECPFYTGPKFTEVVDAKMDHGDRITAKQIMELRYHSQDWPSVADDGNQDPRDLWETLFSEPDIWAWAKDNTPYPDGIVRSPGKGRIDPGTGKPLLQRVTIENFGTESPVFSVGQPIYPEDGTPVIGGPPVYPTLIKPVLDFNEKVRVIFPKGTSVADPFVKRSFIPEDRFFYISFQANTLREIVAINLTKHPQGSLSDEDFVKQTKRVDPEGVSTPFTSGLPGRTLKVELDYDGQVSSLNHIRIFVDTGIGEEDELEESAAGSFDPANERPSLPNGRRKYLKADVYVNHIFYHAHVAQTYFRDSYGHKMIDPWIDHFTQMQLGGQVFALTGNTTLSDVYWNTIAGDGRKTMYAIETQEQISSKDNPNDISWKLLDCGYILVEFLNPKVSRVAPWKAWGQDSKEFELFLRLDRSENDELLEGEPTLVEYELAFASTKGSVIPANMAIFKQKTDNSARNPNPDKDIVVARYAYTEFRQGPIKEGDLLKLKFVSDADKVITAFPYEIQFDGGSFDIDGCFVRAGESKVYSCDQIIGDCVADASEANELLARQSFIGGGAYEESLRHSSQIISRCAEQFNSQHEGQTFEDGVPVSFVETVRRMEKINFREGSQHYLFIFSDETGRPIGSKSVGFLTQSALPQARDVEIRYKWGTQAQHYPNHHQMLMFADLYKPLYATTTRLVYLVQPYDPFCGDHAATDGGTAYRAFDLEIDKHGPLWYPYKMCQMPKYHADSSFFTNVVHYEDTVEGFGSNMREPYWERMRGSDKYMPVVMDYILLVGCWWNETTTTVNNNPPYEFLGYTKIRSSHPFGAYSTDRESLRVSRHWEKRNLAFEEEVIKQGDDDTFTIDLSPEYKEGMYDEEGNLKTGEGLETPIWVHINDGFSVVRPASEDRQHPFGNILLERVGNHLFDEEYIDGPDNRFELRTIVEERDYTSRLDRSEDGTKIYLADGTEVNVEGGLDLDLEQGRDVRWAFRGDFAGGAVAWCWLADPPEPNRASASIGGIFLSNPKSVLFKTNFVPATHTTEGEHYIEYAPHVFAADGSIETQAQISMDGGPPYYIDLESGNIFPPEGSPYSIDSHEGEDYRFVLNGQGPDGVGILADTRGIQRFSVDGVKYATLAGVNINPVIDINELPYIVRDIKVIDRFSLNDNLDALNELLDVYDPDNNDSFLKRTQATSTGLIDFKGHYFVESVDIVFILGDDRDIPTITAEGAILGSEEPGNSTLFSPTQYISGLNYARGTTQRVSFPINLRLKNIRISLGARQAGKAMAIASLAINVRDPVARREAGIFVYAPKFNVSTGNTGTHHPPSLEFYFQRSFPDFAKSIARGQVALAQLAAANVTATFIPGVEIKYNGRRIKDIIPHYEFSDMINNRFPYNNIDISQIQGYTEEENDLGIYKYISAGVRTSSKGWTMYTTEHQGDPGSNLAHPNAYNGVRPFEDIQETLYNQAGALLGDKISVFNSFWHPVEKEFFEKIGVDLDSYSWTLRLDSAVASIDKVFRHEDYGCSAFLTNDFYDGRVHKLENWQARGVFHYQCDPRYNYGCSDVLMNKCETYLFDEFGTEAYLNNDVVGRFTYTFAFPPDDYSSYVSAGLIDKNYFAGVWGGFSPTTAGAAAYSGFPNLPYSTQFDLVYKPLLLPPKGPGPYQ